MAGLTHQVAVPRGTPPWPLVFEIADATPSGSWTLVGGLMVHAHSLRGNVTAMRPTRDVDVLLHIGAATVSDVAGPLVGLGFTPLEPSGDNPIHRFVRGDDVVDVMVARDVRTPTRWSLRPLLRAPGAAQALQRRDTYVLTANEQSVQIDVPDSLGAILAKAAAFEIDSRNPGRHLEDIAVLCAAAGPVRTLGLDSLSSKERKRVRLVHRHLRANGHQAWVVLDGYDREIGTRAWTAIATAAHAS